MKNIASRNVDIMYEDVDKRDEGTGGVSCTDGDTRQDRRKLFHGGGGEGGEGR